MSSNAGAQKFVQDARRALAIVVGAGAAGASNAAPKTWTGLAARAKNLGMPDLADRMNRVAGELEGRGALAFEASVSLADAALAVHDRVEALASTLMLWAVEDQMKEPTNTVMS